MSENTKQSKFCLRCFISGHDWIATFVDETSNPGVRTTTKSWISHCRRCGEPNPTWHRIESEDDTPAAS